MKRLTDRVAIVTGGASGIGAATVKRLAEEGARVVCADINDEAGTGVVAAVTSSGGVAAYEHCDVGDSTQVDALVARTVERFGRLDVMHNNAFATRAGYLVDLEPAAFEASLRVTLTGVFYGMRAAIRQMLAQGTGGSIINTASVDGLFADNVLGPYNAAKAAVINLTRSAALEYGRHGIRINSICPGAVSTPALKGVEKAMGEGSLARIAATHATGRLIDPVEIANVVVFLASEESSAIVGAAIVADGGVTIATGAPMQPPYPG
jgi:NAD(P)-dependent dehydrogenase (short-subunit alcohol dehydrogenase family)